MPAPTLPEALARPATVDENPVAKILIDLTVYLTGPTEDELEFLIDLYERLCPVGAMVHYKIAELLHWVPLARPILTESGRAAAQSGVRRPFLEPVRNRIREGRALEVQFWDGRAIDDSSGSWSFNLRRIFLRSTGLHGFVRILAPLGTDLSMLRDSASEIAENVEFYSGHGGLAFVYDPWKKGQAFDAIYARSRRYWGIDVEDLNATLPQMREAIKSVNWITMVGRPLLSTDIEDGLSELGGDPEIAIRQFNHGSVIISGSQPAIGDQHLPDAQLGPYERVANRLEELHLTEHDDFAGVKFMEAGNTVGWLRRFLEPDGWR